MLRFMHLFVHTPNKLKKKTTADLILHLHLNNRMEELLMTLEILRTHRVQYIVSMWQLEHCVSS